MLVADAAAAFIFADGSCSVGVFEMGDGSAGDGGDAAVGTIVVVVVGITFEAISL